MAKRSTVDCFGGPVGGGSGIGAGAPGIVAGGAHEWVCVRIDVDGLGF